MPRQYTLKALAHVVTQDMRSFLDYQRKYLLSLDYITYMDSIDDYLCTFNYSMHKCKINILVSQIQTVHMSRYCKNRNLKHHPPSEERYNRILDLLKSAKLCAHLGDLKPSSTMAQIREARKLLTERIEKEKFEKFKQDLFPTNGPELLKYLFS